MISLLFMYGNISNTFFFLILYFYFSKLIKPYIFTSSIYISDLSCKHDNQSNVFIYPIIQCNIIVKLVYTYKDASSEGGQLANSVS